MIVASLLDLGANQEKLETAIKSLNLEDFHYHISRKTSYSIAGCDFDVHLHHKNENHEEKYLEHHHGHEHEHNHNHDHNHKHEQSHDHHHEHRHLKDIYEIIDRGEITEKAKQLAKKIFLIIAEAEAKAHGCSIEEVHFHEVGAIDSIVDIISIAVLVDDLNIEKIIVNELADGYGTIMCQHGELPIPVPAVLNIAGKYGIVLKTTNINGEMTTLTGIAAVAALKTDDKLPKTYRVLKTGIGLGKRDFGRANFLRTMIIEDVIDYDDKQNVYMIESNIDDSTAEELGYTMEKLLSAGALDVCFVPCFMKKNRPAYILKVMATEDKLDLIEDLIFRHTSTIGIRRYKVERTCMDRENINVNTKYGTISVKKSSYKDIVRFKSEYDSMKKIADEKNIDLNTVHNEVNLIINGSKND